MLDLVGNMIEDWFSRDVAQNDASVFSLEQDHNHSQYMYILLIFYLFFLKKINK